MATMPTDDVEDMRRKRMCRSDYITDQFHNAVSSLKLDSYSGCKKFLAIVETNCFFLQPSILSLLNPLCIILP